MTTLDFLPLEGEVDAPALTAEGRTLTYDELDAEVWRTALKLRRSA